MCNYNNNNGNGSNNEGTSSGILKGGRMDTVVYDDCKLSRRRRCEKEKRTSAVRAAIVSDTAREYDSRYMLGVHKTPLHTSPSRIPTYGRWTSERGYTKDDNITKVRVFPLEMRVRMLAVASNSDTTGTSSKPR